MTLFDETRRNRCAIAPRSISSHQFIKKTRFPCNKKLKISQLEWRAIWRRKGFPDIHGLSMDNPWIIQGLSMDYPGIILVLSMDYPWIIHGLSMDIHG